MSEGVFAEENQPSGGLRLGRKAARAGNCWKFFSSVMQTPKGPARRGDHVGSCMLGMLGLSWNWTALNHPHARQPGQEPEWRGWGSVRMGGSDNKGDGLASQPPRYRVQGQPLLNWHQVGSVFHSPDGLFAQQEPEPTRGRPAVRGKGTYGGQSGQVWRSRASGPHAHGTTARQVMDSLWTEVWGQQQQSSDPGNNQHNLNTPTTGHH